MMKSIKKASNTFIIVTIMLLGLLVCVSCEKKFSSKRWIHEKESSRYKMADELISSQVLEGLNKDEVITLLGNPNFEKGYSIEYRIKDDPLGGWKVLNIHFHKGLADKAEIMWEDW